MEETKLNGLGRWLHTDVAAGGSLVTSYWDTASDSGLLPPSQQSPTSPTATPQWSYQFSDWLGTRRIDARLERAGRARALRETLRVNPSARPLSLQPEDIKPNRYFRLAEGFPLPNC
jgi:hypothetical protein